MNQGNRPPSHNINGYVVITGEELLSMSAKGCGPGGTSGAHTITLSMVQLHLWGTIPPPGGLASTGSQCLRQPSVLLAVLTTASRPSWRYTLVTTSIKTLKIQNSTVVLLYTQTRQAHTTQVNACISMYTGTQVRKHTHTHSCIFASI